MSIFSKAVRSAFYIKYLRKTTEGHISERMYLCRWYKGPEVNNILPVSGSNFPPHHSKTYISNKTYTIIFFNKLHGSICVYACRKAMCM